MSEKPGKKPRRKDELLMLDDNPGQLGVLVTRVKKFNPDWVVSVPVNLEHAVKATLQNLEQQLADRPKLISVDLEMPLARRVCPEGGLDLLKRLRAGDPVVPLVVHSVMQASESIIRQILVERASYVRTREDPQQYWYAKLVPAMAAGYLVCCGSAATSLESCLRTTSPLTDGEWAILAKLGSAMSIDQIADSLSVSKRTVESRLKQIATKLEVDGLIEPVNRTFDTSGNIYRNRLIPFYHDNRAKFGK